MRIKIKIAAFLTMLTLCNYLYIIQKSTARGCKLDNINSDCKSTKIDGADSNMLAQGEDSKSDYLSNVNSIPPPANPVYYLFNLPTGRVYSSINDASIADIELFHSGIFYHYDAPTRPLQEHRFARAFRGFYVDSEEDYEVSRNQSAINSSSEKGRIWLQNYGFSRFKGDEPIQGKSFETSYQSTGRMGGIDIAIDEHATVGLALGHSVTDVIPDDYLQGASIEGLRIAGHGRYEIGDWYVNGLAGYGRDRQEIWRSVEVLTINSDGDYWWESKAAEAIRYQNEAMFGLETGIHLDLGDGFSLTPAASFTYEGLFQGKYREEGVEPFNLEIEPHDTHSLQSAFHLSGHHTFSLGKESLVSTSAEFTWSHEFGALPKADSGEFLERPITFGMEKPERDAFHLKLETDYFLSPDFTVGATYRREAADNVRQDVLQARMTYRPHPDFEATASYQKGLSGSNKPDDAAELFLTFHPASDLGFRAQYSSTMSEETTSHGILLGMDYQLSSDLKLSFQYNAEVNLDDEPGKELRQQWGSEIIYQVAPAAQFEAYYDGIQIRDGWDTQLDHRIGVRGKITW